VKRGPCWPSSRRGCAFEMGARGGRGRRVSGTGICVVSSLMDMGWSGLGFVCSGVACWAYGPSFGSVVRVLVFNGLGL